MVFEEPGGHLTAHQADELVQHLGDGEPAERVAAAQALKRLSDPLPAVEALTKGASWPISAILYPCVVAWDQIVGFTEADAARNCAVLADAGALPLLVDLLRDETAEIRNTSGVHAAVEALCNLAHGNRERQAEICEAGALPLLIELLAASRGPAEAAATAKALACLMHRHSSVAREAVRLGVVPALLPHLSAGTGAEVEALQALRALAWCKTERPVIIASDAMERLVALASHGSDKAKDGAVAVLWQLSTTDAVSLAVVGAVAPLMAVLRGHGEAEGRRYAKAALENLIRRGGASEEIALAIGCSTHSSVQALLGMLDNIILEEDLDFDGEGTAGGTAEYEVELLPLYSDYFNI